MIEKSSKTCTIRTGFTTNKILGNTTIFPCSALGNNQNQACSALWKENAREKSYFRMPNLALSKCATPMNQHLESRVFTSKSSADLSIQNTFKAWSTQPDMARYQYIEHFILNEWRTEKSTQTYDESPQLSKYAARQTLYFEGILHFQRQMCGKRCKI